MNIEIKSGHQLHAIWEALQQYIDNNDPADLEEAECPPRLRERHAAAIELRDRLDAVVASLALGNVNPRQIG